MGKLNKGEAEANLRDFEQSVNILSDTIGLIRNVADIENRIANNQSSIIHTQKLILNELKIIGIIVYASVGALTGYILGQFLNYIAKLYFNSTVDTQLITLITVIIAVIEAFVQIVKKGKEEKTN